MAGASANDSPTHGVSETTSKPVFTARGVKIRCSQLACRAAHVGRSYVSTPTGGREDGLVQRMQSTVRIQRTRGEEYTAEYG